MQTLKLNETTDIPVLGLGTWKLFEETCVEAITQALELGFRHIDTADSYGNHIQVAQGIKNSKIDRKELFIVTKLPAEDLSKEAVIKNADRYLKELDTEYLDLLLIHWPNRAFPIEETLEAMSNLKEAGKIRAMGVSNFTIHHLQDALATGYEVSVNQVELHPSFNQKELKNFADKNNILLTAYSPVGRGLDLQNDMIIQIADKYFATPAQVVLAWIRSQNIIAIPKASGFDHLKENFESINLTLSKEDIKVIDSISQNPRMVGGITWGDFDY